MTGDVMAELDAWLGAWEGPDDYRLTVQRARDEIVRLREIAARPSPELHALTKERDQTRAAILALQDTVERQRLVLSKGHAQTRDDALEDAALVCEGGYTTGSMRSTLKAIAAAIRALKDRRDE